MVLVVRMKVILVDRERIVLQAENLDERLFLQQFKDYKPLEKTGYLSNECKVLFEYNSLGHENSTLYITLEKDKK